MEEKDREEMFLSINGKFIESKEATWPKEMKCCDIEIVTYSGSEQMNWAEKVNLCGF